VAGARGRTRSKIRKTSLDVGALPSTILSDPTPLIGRESELEAVRIQLLGDSVRLLTVTGAGGIGKTRLALAAARCSQPAFPDGVWYVDLAPLHDPSGIDAAIRQALRLEEAAILSPAERVIAYVKDRRLLLVLDNFEHVLPASARVAELLATAPQLKVLVTSREPLNLRLEHRLPLAGLALPDLRAPDPASVTQAPAGALFLEHARRIQPDFVLTEEAARPLAELLHRLDGIPLAIRIAAAHSNVLSPAAMLSRLRGQALLAAEEARDAAARHHTLGDAMEWSYNLLGERAQAVFRQLGAFVGGWTLEAAEAVIGDQDPATPVWSTLAALVDKSLVQADARASNERRYRLLEPIRQYARQRLVESGEIDEARQRHTRYYITLAEQAEGAMWGPEERTWLQRLEAEHENLRAALRWTAERGDTEGSLRLAGALAEFWAYGGYLREGRRWLERTRALGEGTPSLLRAKALGGEGYLALFQGDYGEARALLQGALALVDPSTPALEARVRWRLGAVAALQGDACEARTQLDRSLPLCRQVGNASDAACAALHLGRTFILLGDLQRAEAMSTDGLNFARSAGSKCLTAFALMSQAHLKLKQGDYAGAAGVATEALSLAQEARFWRGIKYVVEVAALLSDRGGDAGRGLRLLSAVEPWTERAGEVVNPAWHVAAAHADLRARAMRQLGEAAYRAAVAEAQAMSVDEVVAMARESLVSPERHGPAVSVSADRSGLFLSDRERAILRLIAEGLPNKQIATSLNIAERTVKSHLTSAMNKLGVDNRAHAAAAAIQRDLL